MVDGGGNGGGGNDGGGSTSGFSKRAAGSNVTDSAAVKALQSSGMTGFLFQYVLNTERVEDSMTCCSLKML